MFKRNANHRELHVSTLMGFCYYVLRNTDNNNNNDNDNNKNNNNNQGTKIF